MIGVHDYPCHASLHSHNDSFVLLLLGLRTGRMLRVVTKAQLCSYAILQGMEILTCQELAEAR